MIVKPSTESDGIGGVTAIIDESSIQINDEVIITKADGTWFKSVVLNIDTPSDGLFGLGTDPELIAQGIWFFSQRIDYAEEGDEVGLLLRGISRKDISKGDVVTKN